MVIREENKRRQERNFKAKNKVPAWCTGLFLNVFDD